MDRVCAQRVHPHWGCSLEIVCADNSSTPSDVGVARLVCVAAPGILFSVPVARRFLPLRLRRQPDETFIRRCTARDMLTPRFQISM